MTRLALPKGRMQDAVFDLLRAAGLDLQATARSYRPESPIPGYVCKVLKPRNIVEMLHEGTRDVGFAGADWVAELAVELVCVLDLGFDPVRVVAAAPEELLVDGRLPTHPLRVASEYENLARAWIEKRGLSAHVVRTFGATEVFPPEDADCIVDNVATGATLRANRLVIVDELMTSSTRLYANPRSMEDPAHRMRIEQLALLLSSVLAARHRVLLELNVPIDRLDAIVEVLPCMRQPTVSRLLDDAGYAVKAAVTRCELPRLIPELKARGGTDLLVSTLSQIVP